MLIIPRHKTPEGWKDGHVKECQCDVKKGHMTRPLLLSGGDTLLYLEMGGILGITDGQNLIGTHGPRGVP